MLALTTDAVEAIEAIVRNPELPPRSVVRITLEQRPTRFRPGELDVRPAACSRLGDVEIDGVPIAVDPAAFEMIDDMVLDAQSIEFGSRFEFRLYEQPEDFAREGILSDVCAPALAPQI